MRGLKLRKVLQHEGNEFVASFTDAWIETLERNARKEQKSVASFTDAWIETPI